VEWVEVTGKTVEEAVEAALEQLGVALKDAEIVVVEEPKLGMFGLRRSSARVRARVRPVQPRAKRPSHRPRAGVPNEEHGRRRQSPRSESSTRKSSPKADTEQAASKTQGANSASAARGSRRKASPKGEAGEHTAGSSQTKTGAEESGALEPGAESSAPASVRKRSRSRGHGDRERQAGNTEKATKDTLEHSDRETRSPKEAQMSIETQQQLASDFVKEVVARFGFEATTTVRLTEDDGIYISVAGENLGLLVGPKGATIDALQELTRTVVQRHTEEHTNRIVVDVGGYRARRAEALRQFVRGIADDVALNGVPEALEPMSPSDRKVVHDTVNEIEGLATTSEGLEPRRYVVIGPVSKTDDASTPAQAEPESTEPDETTQEPS